MEKTLEELRAENAAAETAASQVPQTEEVVVEKVAAEGTSTEGDLAEGGEGEEGRQAEPESWMKGDDQESQGAEKKFTDRDIGAVKAKVRAKVEREHQSEIETLRAQLEEARRNNVAPQPSARPKREDFYDHDDPDDAYAEALTDWKLNERMTQQHGQSQQYEAQRKQLEAQQKINDDVDKHYERAAVLATQSGISPELYQSADLRVRSAIEGIFPGGGENVTNALIASLGEGSEKVLYNLGVNAKRLAELTNLLAQDSSGIKASIYLGKLSSELTAPLRKKSSTPAPATSVQGDMQTSDAGKALHRKYMEASKAGDAQKAFSLRRQARASGVNTTSW
jgi:hypothetical protein